MTVTQERASTMQTAAGRLRTLAGELSRLGWDTRVTTHPGMHPALLLRDTAPGAAAVAEYILAVELGRHWFYEWSRCCGSDPADAAATISHVMRSARQTPALEGATRSAGTS
jgi:hypothetical protein